MGLFVVSVVGADRPGIIAEVTAALAQVGANLEDSTMSVLRGRLAMMMVVSASVPQQEMSQAIAGLTSDALHVSCRTLEQLDAQASQPCHPFTLSVYGADQPGLVSAITAEVARLGGNITDLSTRLIAADGPGGHPLYVLLADVDLPEQVPQLQLREALAHRATQVGVRVSLRQADADLL